LNAVSHILVCPLNWGLGHATRCIPIIKQLLSNNLKVSIAGSGKSLQLLKTEFPELTFIPLQNYHIRYPEKGSMFFRMLAYFPYILMHLFIEHRKLKKIIAKYQIHAVISDNRYGLYSKRITSIFITHQLMIKCPAPFRFLEPLLYLINIFFISRYSQCWVPDYRGKINLSGDLSHKYRRLKNIYFIGPLSRFYDTKHIHLTTAEPYEIMIVISGPEPQRSIFENIAISQLSRLNKKSLIVSGKPDENNKKLITDFITVVPHLNTDELYYHLLHAKIVICRSGYSGIMDLCSLGIKAILVPTPGQTEQEYLAQYFFKRNIFYAVSQNKLDICSDINKSEGFNGMKLNNNTTLIDRRIKELFQLGE